VCKRARKSCTIIRSSSNFFDSSLAPEESGVWWVAPPPSTASNAVAVGSISEMLTFSAAPCNKKAPPPRVLSKSSVPCNGETALPIVSKSGGAEAVQAMVESSADVHSGTDDDRTALH